MKRFAPLALSLALFSVLASPLARADFKDDLLKSLIRRITQEALSRILGDRVCASSVADSDAQKPSKAPAGKAVRKSRKPTDDYCVRIKDGLEKSISGIMNKDFYSVQSGVKDIGVAFLEKKYLDWLGESTFAKELEDYPYLSMKGVEMGEGLQNFIRKAASISALVPILANIPACIRWIAEEGKSDPTACKALLRPESLAKISFPDDATPDDQERVSDFVNFIFEKEQPDSYLVDRVKDILGEKKLPQSIPEMLPLVTKVTHKHADVLAEDYQWLGKAFTAAFPKMIGIVLDKQPCKEDESTKGLRAFSAWIGKECAPN